MLRAVEYIDNQGEAILYRCYGEGGYPQLPDYVDGLPVTELADHCFAPEPSFRLRNRPRKMARLEPDGTFRSEGNKPDGAAAGAQPFPEMAGMQIEEVYLPRYVRSIGNYTFYGCRNLKRLYVPAAFVNEGGGSFVDVHQLKEIYFSLADDGGPFPQGLKAMIIDIPDETEAVVLSAGGQELYRLVFPGYYEESKENTPARIIQVVYQGMGFKYRQCLKDGVVDMRRYDSLFYETKVQEFPDTVMNLAFDRLALAQPAAGTPAGRPGMTGMVTVGQPEPETREDLLAPLRPSQQAQEEYIAYLQAQADSVCRVMAEGRQTDRLRLLCRLSYFDRERLELFLGEAGSAGWAEAASLLMEYRRIHFAAAGRHKYEL